MNTDQIQAFRALQQKGAPFVMPNPWDVGSARILAGLGFPALATTSSGFALSLGRRDYGVSREEALAHAALLADSVAVPVSADLENGFGSSPEDAAETIRLAASTRLAGASIEDSSGDPARPILDEDLAVARVAAAAEAARQAGTGFVLTARTELLLHGGTDLAQVLHRLRRYERAGADVLFAPGLPDLAAVRAVCAAVERPVNVLVLRGLRDHSLAELAACGVARVSLGAGLAWLAYGTLADARIMLTEGRFGGLRAGADSAPVISPHLRGR